MRVQQAFEGFDPTIAPFILGFVRSRTLSARHDMTLPPQTSREGSEEGRFLEDSRLLRIDLT